MMSDVTMAQALNAALRDALTADERVVVFGEDVGPLGGVFRVTDGLTRDFGDQRCFDTPLAEAGIVGFALGMAIGGFRPVVELQFDAFAYPAFEQITSHAAKLRNRTRGVLSAPIVIRVPYAGGIGGVEHHSDSSEAYYAHTPGLKVVTPATPADAYSLLRDAIDDPDPVVFLEPKKLYWSKASLALPVRTPPFGTAAIRRAGADVTLVAYGPTVPVALAAAEAAAEDGVDCEVIDLRTLVPYDDDMVCASVRRTGRCVVVAEAAGFAGFAAEVAARVQERCFHFLHAPVLRVTGLRHPVPAAAAGTASPPRRRPGTRRGGTAAVGGPARHPLGVRGRDLMNVFCLPDLGEGLADAEIVRWRVEAGDEVAVDQVIVEVETAKAAVELPSPYAGRVSALHGEAGQIVAVGAPLVTIDAYDRATVRAGGTATATAAAPAAAAAPATATQDGAGPGQVLVGSGPVTPGPRRRRRGRSAGGSPSGDRVPAPRPAASPTTRPSMPDAVRVLSPIVRRLARDNGIDVRLLTGSGPGGIILRADVQQAIEAGPPVLGESGERADEIPARDARAAAGAAANPGPVRVPLRGTHRAMADAVVRSHREIPDACTWVDVDATGLLAARQDLRVAYPDQGVGVLALLARICVAGLGRFPELNATVEGEELVRLPTVNLGFAAQTDRGLVVPVVHEADRLTTLELAHELNRLTTKARDGSLTPCRPHRRHVHPQQLRRVRRRRGHADHPTPRGRHARRRPDRRQAVGRRRSAGRTRGRSALTHVRPPGVRRRRGRQVPAVRRRRDGAPGGLARSALAERAGYAPPHSGSGA